jgi:5'-nucleotidase
LHFNDVYDIQPTKKGNFGIVNFEAYLRKLKANHPNNIVLFSGDCFSPSILSNIYEGKQMVTSLNKLKIDVACFGNHEFDFHP